MISRDAHRSHQFASVGPTGPREMHAPRPRARPFLSFSFSSSSVLPFPLILAVPPISPSSAADFLVLHSAASLIVHVRLDARNGVACSAINGTLRFSRSGISPRTSLFVRESVQSRRTGRLDSPRRSPATGLHARYICVHAPRDLGAIMNGDLAGPRELP